MANLSTTIMEEFLRAGTPQIRKNSLTALALLGDDDGARLIATTAIHDEDSSVRDRAAAETVSIGEKSPQKIVGVLTEVFQQKDQPKQQQRAYAILGRLRSKGVDIPHARLPWGSRMWLAGSMFFYVYPARNWTFRLRSWKPGLLGTLVGMVPFLALLVFLSRPIALVTGIGVALAGVGLLIPGTLIPVFATQFTTPINFQLRRSAALWVELLVSFVCTVVCLVIAYIILSFLPIFGRYQPTDFIPFIPLIALLAALVRLGTIVAFGRFPNVTRSKGKTWNWIYQVIGGTLTGGSILAIFAALLIADAKALHESVGPYWLGFLAALAVTIGLACAFARIDGEAPPNTKKAS